MMVLLNYLLQFVIAGAATTFFGAMFRVEKRHYLACALVGGTGWLCYLLCINGAGLSPAVATFVATLPLTLLARLLAKRHKAPVTVFLLCGIFPLVPGAGIYYTAYYFLQDQRALCLDKGVETAKIAVAIAIGIALVASLPSPGGGPKAQSTEPKAKA